MKKLLFIPLVILFSCSSKSDKEIEIMPKSDTSRTFLVYLLNNKVINDIGWRITRDTFKLVEIDENTAKKKWTKDTFYFVPYMDTVRDRMGIPVKDSSGKYKPLERILNLKNQYIIADAGINLDSIVKAHTPMKITVTDTTITKTVLQRK